MCVYVCVSHLQRLSGSHKALVEMQDDVAELLRSATQDYASTKVRVQFFIGSLSRRRCVYRISLGSGEG